MPDATCKTCPYWTRNVDPSRDWGLCRTTVLPDEVSGTPYIETVWPDTRQDDTCGDHPDRKEA